MNTRRFFALLLALLMVTALLVGCSSKEAYSEELPNSSDSINAPGETADSKLPANRKLIRTLYLRAETEDMDTLLSHIDTRIAELEGYVEAREVYNGSMYNSSRYRHATLTIRIPAAQLDAFVEQVDNASNIINRRETTEDVTLSYVATQSRITALETEQERLLELLAQAKTVDELLQIESRLTDVRTQLEQVTSQLRLYDNMVDYGTIHLELEEVVEYTEPDPETVWDRISTGFVNSLKGVGTMFKEIFIFLIVALPYLVLIAAVVALIVWRAKKKRAAKKAAQEAAPLPEQKNEP